MESRTAVGVAPLVTGLALFGTSSQRLLGALASGEWSASGVAALAGTVGSLAAVAVGAGILLGWRSFETDDGERSGGLLLGIAAAAFALGAAGAAL